MYNLNPPLWSQPTIWDTDLNKFESTLPEDASTLFLLFYFIINEPLRTVGDIVQGQQLGSPPTKRPRDSIQPSVSHTCKFPEVSVCVQKDAHVTIDVKFNSECTVYTLMVNFCVSYNF